MMTSDCEKCGRYKCRCPKAGDRVAVYHLDLDMKGEKGVVTHAYDNGQLAVKLHKDSPCNLLVHSKQCRRLIKKERRGFWVSRLFINDKAATNDGMGHAVTHLESVTKEFPEYNWIRVTEVRRK